MKNVRTLSLETAHHAAKRWGVTRACISLWIRQGTLPPERVHKVTPRFTMLVYGPRPVTRDPGRPRGVKNKTKVKT